LAPSSQFPFAASMTPSRRRRRHRSQPGHHLPRRRPDRELPLRRNRLHLFLQAAAPLPFPSCLCCCMSPSGPRHLPGPHLAQSLQQATPSLPHQATHDFLFRFPVFLCSTRRPLATSGTVRNSLAPLTLSATPSTRAHAAGLDS
jgi:hypothetical protein